MNTREGCWWLNFASAVILGFAAVALTLCVCGCKSFYDNGGSSVRVGTLTAPIEVSDATESFSLRLLYSMDGAYAYTRKDSMVTVEYENCWTNNYIGCIETVGRQHLKVDVEPLDCSGGADTNSVEEVAQ